jgi:SOS-response transcriptional repressor LexA
MAKENINSNQLSKKTGVKQPVIHRILSGETLDPKVGTITSLAKYFQVSINDLVGEETSSSHSIPLTTLNEVYGVINGQISTDESFDIGSSDLRGAIAVQIKDSTMRPRFAEDTVIVIEQGVEVKNRDYVVVYLQEKNNTLFRQILFDGDDVYLKPLNNDFPILQVKSQYKILGCVKQAFINFKD